MNSRELPVWQAYLLISLFALVLYLPSINYNFTYDDTIQVEHNSYITEELSLREIIGILGKSTHPGDLYRPLTLLTIKFNQIWTGLDPWSYHLVNIVLHLSVSLLGFYLIQLIITNRTISCMAGLLFAVHPIHIEAVANIYNRSELLAAGLGIASLILFLKARMTNSFYRAFLAGFFFLMGLLAKESAITILPIIWILILLKSERRLSIKRQFFLSLPSVFFCLLYLLIRFSILSNSFVVNNEVDSFQIENPLLGESFTTRFFPSLYILGEYIRLLLLPLHLSADYSLPKKYFDDLISSWPGYSGILLTLAYILLVFNLFRIKSSSKFWALFFLVSFSLTINLFLPIGTFIADRLAYLPSLGFLTLIAIGISKLPYQKVLFWIYLIFLSIQTTDRLPVWKDNLSLFEQTINDNSVSPKAAFNLGNRQYMHGYYEASVESYKEALFRDPTFTIAAKFMINSYARMQDWKRVRYWSKKYLQVEPQDQEVRDFLNKISQF